MPAILGLDIGTSSSAVAYTTEGFPLIQREGRYEGKGFLSCLSFDADGNILKASGQVRDDQDKSWGFLLQYFKRIMGYNFGEIRHSIRSGERFLNGYKDIIEMKSGGKLLIRLGKNEYTPESIMAAFLKTINLYAEKVMGETTEEAVITVPWHFSSAQREMMRMAGEMVFDWVELIEEPLAAILGCKLEVEAKKQPVVVFDMGIGNLEIKVVKIDSSQKGKPELIALNKMGSLKIGGIDIDYLILEYLMKRNRNLRDVFPAASDRERRNFLWMIEDAKIALSSKIETRVAGMIEGEPIDEGLTRRELEKLTQPIIKDCEGALRNALDEAGLRPEEAGHLILVGGSSQMPAVRQMLKEVFRDNTQVTEMLKEREKAYGVDPWPMWVVAKGAAAYPVVYPAVDHRVPVKEKVVSEAEFTYEFFYDKVGLVPIINKRTAFEEDGSIQRKNTVIFSRPDTQLPLIQREETKGKPYSYRCLGIFDFFLPLKKPYQITFTFVLNKERLALIGWNNAIGKVVYPSIPLELNVLGIKSVDEITLKEDLHNLMLPQKSFYSTIDSEEARKAAQAVHKKIAAYYRVPKLKDITDRLAESIYWFKDSLVSQETRQTENKIAVMLNRSAEACFALLKYEAISFDDYRDMIKALHYAYRAGV
ncbi:MAG: Hsp70 family protein [bacterium]